MTPNRAVLMNSREQSRLQLYREKVKAEKPAVLLPVSLHSTMLKTSEDFLQRLTLPHNSIFVCDFVLFNAAK